MLFKLDLYLSIPLIRVGPTLDNLKPNLFAILLILVEYWLKSPVIINGIFEEITVSIVLLIWLNISLFVSSFPVVGLMYVLMYINSCQSKLSFIYVIIIWSLIILFQTENLVWFTNNPIPFVPRFNSFSQTIKCFVKVFILSVQQNFLTSCIDIYQIYLLQNIDTISTIYLCLLVH